jgi:translation initiation factor 5
MENIGESNAGDTFYRYKRPKLVARIEGRGNGIKTNTVNLVDISKALERPPDYVLKFFGCELGAQTKYDKTSGTCIVNGAHEVSKLNELLESFTKKYVQCHQCGNPETRIRIKKEMIYLKCKACGATSDVDMRHRLNTYIIKNPPEDKISKAEKRLKKQEEERMQEAAGDNLDKEAKVKKDSKKKDKEDKKKRKKGAKGEKEDSPDPSATEGGEDDDEDDDDDNDEVQWSTDTSAAAIAARAAEQLSGATADMVTQGNIEAEREEVRKAEKARKKEEARLAAEAEAKAAAEAEAEAAARAQADEDAKRKAGEDAKLAAEAQEKIALGDYNGDPVVLAVRELAAAPDGYNPKKVTSKLKQLGFEDHPAKRARLVYLALFGNLGTHKLGPQIEAHAEVLQAEAGEDTTKQIGQLLALEYLVGVALPDKTRQTAVALKALYDEDVVDEGCIQYWHEKEGAAKVLGVPPDAALAVRIAAKPFVDWLAEASDEEDDEDSDEE